MSNIEKYLVHFIVTFGFIVVNGQMGGAYFDQYPQTWGFQPGNFNFKLDLDPPVEQNPFFPHNFDQISGINRGKFGFPALPSFPVQPEIKPLHHYRRTFKQQLVDHFNREADLRWEQPYYIDMSYLEHNAGPIFLDIGAEFDIAKHFEITQTPFQEFPAGFVNKYKAAQISLQHRYYAPDAYPFANGTLAELSSEQALADAAYFIQEVLRKELGLTGVLIIAGCSYGGSLAVWFRAKYPHLVHGAIAKSPVLVAKLDIPDFTEHVENIARKMYPECMRNMDYHIPSVKKKLQENKSHFLRNLNICPYSTTSAEEILKKIMLTYTSKFMAYAQRGYNQTLKGKNLIGDKFCPLLSMGDAYAALGAVLTDALMHFTCPNHLYSTCLDIDVLFDMNKLDKICKPMASLTQTDSNAKMWNWQKCTEFGWFMTVPNERSVFKFYTLKEHMELFCYNVSIHEVARHVAHTNAIYGGLNLEEISRVLIIDGEHDPWRLLSLSPTGFFKPNGVSSFVIKEANHCPKADEITGQALDVWLR